MYVHNSIYSRGKQLVHEHEHEHEHNTRRHIYDLYDTDIIVLKLGPS